LKSSSNNSVSGWLFDIYPLEDKMIFWIKQKNGSVIRLEDNWTHSIYVAADDKTDLKSILVENKENDITTFLFRYIHQMNNEYGYIRFNA
jgi:hypothetical protein